MSATACDVQLLTCTPDAEALVYAAMRQCYSSGYAAQVFGDAVSDIYRTGEEAVMARERILNFINGVLASGHESPVEHVSMTFAISGVSRALTHQLVRHRIATYSQQSQRYVNANGFQYIIPPKVAAVPEAEEEFNLAMERAAESYAKIQELLKAAGHATTANEDARFVLPNACETRIVVTMNIRSLLHFFQLRCCQRAQWEIRGMANQMLRIAKQEIPGLFGYAGPTCTRLGYCPEGARTCGKAPTRQDLLNRWENS